MGWRKAINFPTKVQSYRLNEDIEVINTAIKYMVGDENADQKEAETSHNETCPNCRKGKAYIVDKFSRISATSILDGDIKLGFGKLKGKVVFDTLPINHCKNCEHEWVKYKAKEITEENVLRTVLKYLVEIMKDPNQKRYAWKYDAVKKLEGHYAEAIFKLNKTKSNSEEVYFSEITLKKLRKYFYSVYDVGHLEKVELKKL